MVVGVSGVENGVETGGQHSSSMVNGISSNDKEVLTDENGADLARSQGPESSEFPEDPESSNFDDDDDNKSIFVVVEEVEAAMRPGHVLEYGRYLLLEKIDFEFHGPLLDNGSLLEGGDSEDHSRALPYNGYGGNYDGAYDGEGFFGEDQDGENLDGGAGEGVEEVVDVEHQNEAGSSHPHPPNPRHAPKHLDGTEIPEFAGALWRPPLATQPPAKNQCGKDDQTHYKGRKKICPANSGSNSGAPYYYGYGGGFSGSGSSSAYGNSNSNYGGSSSDGSVPSDSLFRRRGLHLPYTHALNEMKETIGLPPRQLITGAREQALQKLPWWPGGNGHIEGDHGSGSSGGFGRIGKNGQIVTRQGQQQHQQHHSGPPRIAPSPSESDVAGGDNVPITLGDLSEIDNMPILPPAALFSDNTHAGTHGGVQGSDPDENMYGGGSSGEGFAGSTRFGRGAYGEAWRAVEMRGDQYREVVLKRLFSEKGEHVTKSGEREIFFGIKLKYAPHVARYLDHFYREGPASSANGREENGDNGNDNDKDNNNKKKEQLWLVFLNEGYSLRHLLWWVPPSDGKMRNGEHRTTQLVPSPFWWSLKGAGGMGGGMGIHQSGRWQSQNHHSQHSHSMTEMSSTAMGSPRSSVSVGTAGSSGMGMGGGGRGSSSSGAGPISSNGDVDVYFYRDALTSSSYGNGLTPSARPAGLIQGSYGSNGELTFPGGGGVSSSTPAPPPSVPWQNWLPSPAPSSSSEIASGNQHGGIHGHHPGHHGGMGGSGHELAHHNQLFPPGSSGKEQVKSLMYQLLHGLAEMHALNITHRDIKTSNLLVRESLFPLRGRKEDDRNEFGWERNGGNKTSAADPTGRGTSSGSSSSNVGSNSGVGGTVSGGGLEVDSPTLHLRIADLGSAVLLEDKDGGSGSGSKKEGEEEHGLATKRLYGENGPSGDEETPDYRPPEAYILDGENQNNKDDSPSPGGGDSAEDPNENDSNDHNDPNHSSVPKPLANPYFRGPSYDVFSAGLCFLEIVTGRPSSEIFQIRHDPVTVRHSEFVVPEDRLHDPRKQRLLELRYRQMGYTDLEISSALRVHAFMDSCVRPAATACGDGVFQELLIALDLAGEGLPDANARDLLRRMLTWEPNRRISAQEALNHPWFHEDEQQQQHLHQQTQRQKQEREDHQHESQRVKKFQDTRLGSGAASSSSSVGGHKEKVIAEDHEGDSPEYPEYPDPNDPDDPDADDDDDNDHDPHQHPERDFAIQNCLVSGHLVQGRRPYMEDAHSIESIGPLEVFAVYDGHYGAEVAFALRDNFLSVFLRDKLWGVVRETEALGDVHSGEEGAEFGGVSGGNNDDVVEDQIVTREQLTRKRIPEVLRESVYSFDQWIRAEQQRLDQVGGSTMSLGVLDKRSGTLYTVQIGDSEVWKVSQSVTGSVASSDAESVASSVVGSAASSDAGISSLKRSRSKKEDALIAEKKRKRPDDRSGRGSVSSVEAGSVSEVDKDDVSNEPGNPASAVASVDIDSEFQTGQKVLIKETGELGKIESIRFSAGGGKKMYLVQLQERSSQQKRTKFYRSHQLKPRIHGMQVHPLVELHKPDPASATTIITSDGMPRVGGKLATSRSVGRLPEGLKPLVPTDPDITIHELQPGEDDIIIVGSDGLFDDLPARECAEIVHSVLRGSELKASGGAGELHSASKLLVDTALDRGAGDNISVVLVKLVWGESAMRDAMRGARGNAGRNGGGGKKKFISGLVEES